MVVAAASGVVLGPAEEEVVGSGASGTDVLDVVGPGVAQPAPRTATSLIAGPPAASGVVVTMRTREATLPQPTAPRSCWNVRS